MTHDTDWLRIARYLGGDCSEAERRAFEARLAADPAWREAVDAARYIWESTAPEPDQWNVPAAWQELAQKQAKLSRAPIRLVHQQPPVDATLPALPARLRRGLRAGATWAAVAAAAMAAVGAALWFRNDLGNRPSAVAAAPVYTITTKPGQRLDLRMPDGTRVVLGVASTLRYAKTYGVAQRQLFLDGQAYFEVTHDDAKPFTVRARNAVARDVGTRFDVRAYADDSDVEVTVAEGEVELASTAVATTTAPAAAQRALVARGQVGRVNDTGGVTTRAAADLDRRLAWIDGRLVFKDVPLRDMLRQLSRWYDVDFRLADPALGERRLDATFQDESVAALLQFLAFSLDASYQWDDRTVILTPNHRAR